MIRAVIFKVPVVVIRGEFFVDGGFHRICSNWEGKW
jgi:hypothetical protein